MPLTKESYVWHEQNEDANATMKLKQPQQNVAEY